jgi:hypothetical protein
MVVLDASRRHHPGPPPARWSLPVGIVATIDASLSHGTNHGLIGALESAWPALAVVASFELLMLLIETRQRPNSDAVPDSPTPQTDNAEPPVEQTVRSRHAAGGSQQSIARDLNMACRKVNQMSAQRSHRSRTKSLCCAALQQRLSWGGRPSDSGAIDGIDSSSGHTLTIPKFANGHGCRNSNTLSVRCLDGRLEQSNTAA